MSYFTQISYSDTGSLDAFSRLRVSNPDTIFSTQCQYDAAASQMESFASGTGTLPAHDANTRMVALVSTGTGTSAFQSYQYSPYFPGKSQFIAITGVIGSGVAGATVDTGYFDAANGVIFRQNGATNLQLILRTSTGGSVSDANIVAQSAWNIDKMDGTGASGITLDITKSFILIIDLQFLGMGRVRVGFDINGVVYYVHQFLNANSLTVPYMQTATLPIGMLVTTTAGAKTSYFKCAAVASEGGVLTDYGYRQSTPRVLATAGIGVRVPLLAIRPKTTFNGIVNREMLILNDLNFFVAGAFPVFFELVIGGAYGGQTFADVNTTYSGFEYASVPGTYTNLTGGIVLSSGYAGDVGGKSGGLRLPFDANQSLHNPITLNRAGAVRALGTLTVLGTGIGGASAVHTSLDFTEIR